MTAPSTGFKDLLVAAGVGIFPPTVGEWPIYISKLPDKPDKAIALFDSGGLSAWPRSLLDFPDLSVNIRGKTYSETFDKIKDIKDAVLGLPPQIINGDEWASVIQIGEFAFMGYDKKDRPMFTSTYRLTILPADTGGNHRNDI